MTWHAIYIGVLMVLVWLVSIVAHEIGHYLVLQAYKKKPKFKRTKSYIAWSVNMDDLTPVQKLNVYSAGIFAGMLIGVINFIDIAGWIGVGCFLGLYLIGCRHDIKKIYEVLKDG